MSRLETIEILIPNHIKGRLLVELLKDLVSGLEYAECNDTRIILGSRMLLPRISFQLEDSIDTININFGKGISNSFTRFKQSDYNVQRLDFLSVLRRLKNHILRVDHVGLNIPTCLYSKDEWNMLISCLSSKCNLYNYPSDKPWPFILPATQKEHENEISDFSLVREPRFELVYDLYTDKNTIQIDLEVDLKKDQVDELFPDGEGVYFDGLENVFKAVYVDFDSVYDIRLDIRFPSDAGKFKTGAWFIENGERVR